MRTETGHEPVSEPLPELTAGPPSLSDEALMPEEAEEDLANNNDPNNNSSNDDDQAVAAAAALAALARGPAEEHSSPPSPDPEEMGLERDISLITKLIPGKDEHTIRLMLENHRSNLARVQVKKIFINKSRFALRFRPKSRK